MAIANDSRTRLRQKLTQWLVTGIAILSGIATVFSIIAGYFSFRLLLHLLWSARWDILAGPCIVLSALWAHKALWPRWKHAFSPSGFDRFMIGILATLAVILALFIVRLEVYRLNLLRYEAGPSFVIELEADGKKSEAALVAKELRKLRINSRFDQWLSTIEMRARNEDFIAAQLQSTFVRAAGVSSPVELLDHALFGLYLEPKRHLYLDSIRDMEKIWTRSKALTANAAPSLEPPAFSMEVRRILCILHSTQPALKDCRLDLYPADLRAFEAMRAARGNRAAAERATGGQTIESWLRMAAQLEQNGNPADWPARPPSIRGKVSGSGNGYTSGGRLAPAAP
jgi:hypothetical protein